MERAPMSIYGHREDMVGLIVSVVVLDTFDNMYWKWLDDWSEPFSVLRDLASWAFLSRHGY